MSFSISSLDLDDLKQVTAEDFVAKPVSMSLVSHRSTLSERTERTNSDDDDEEESECISITDMEEANDALSSSGISIDLLRAHDEKYSREATVVPQHVQEGPRKKGPCVWMDPRLRVSGKQSGGRNEQETRP